MLSFTCTHVPGPPPEAPPEPMAAMATAVGANVSASCPSTTATAPTCSTADSLSPTWLAANAAASGKLGNNGILAANHVAVPPVPRLTTTVTARMKTRAPWVPRLWPKRCPALSSSATVAATSVALFNSMLAFNTSRKASTPK
ncbi:hypothetical protein STIAU_5714 [Stigmatella aurantiaca DW4/3-1]|uniref:Uncharacterized protein n=1 Tax=Stigmatella aurantiaca (strain DW4/3-1) TaxID=378806 RepID=Q08ZD0_STIAD|nr:hypothetical protein STIAU_5714 [Stigmatella aurantiaca DW4/3-1]